MKIRAETGRAIKPPLGQCKCPECGGIMAEVDRCVENGVIFIWYECGLDSCTGQWLQKMHA